MIVFALVFGWCLHQVDFVLAYTQAPIEMDMYMELPDGIEPKGGSKATYVLKLLSNLYGQKQAGRVWNQYLVDKPLDAGLSKSLIDDRVFYPGSAIFIVYVDDGIFLGRSDEQLTSMIRMLQEMGLRIDDQGHPADYVGVNIKKLPDGSYVFSQLALIEAILKDLGMSSSHKIKRIPMSSSKYLHAHIESKPFYECDQFNFNYRSVIGKLNYLAQTSRPDIIFAVHQLARFSADPREDHGVAMMYLGMYLNHTKLIGIKFKIQPDKGFECYADADFAGAFSKEHSDEDPVVAKSRSGWYIFYAGCPIAWASKLQTMVALSTTEAEYIALSNALRDVIPIMELVREMKSRKFDVISILPYVYCKAFEDNSGALELARLPKMRSRTKHIAVCYHHFREHVRAGKIKVYPIDTKDPPADVATKALAQDLCVRHRRQICGE